MARSRNNMKQARKKNVFTKLEMPNLPKATFDLSHDVKTTFQMGSLIPSLLMEAVPGDQFTINAANLIRFMPMIAPVMHKVTMDTHYFFVPNRILSDEWEDFITGDTSVLDPFHRVPSEVAYLITGKGQIGDYLGLPVGTIPTNDISIAPLLAYWKIFNEYYRDQNLQSEIEPDFDNYDDIIAAYNAKPLKRAWEHDYFTSALPFAQKGDDVSLPLIQGGSNLPVELDSSMGTSAFWLDTSGGQVPGGGNLETDTAGRTFQGSPPINVNYDPNGTLHVDINAEAATINTLRNAFRLQEWLEKNARGGTRYIEHVLAHFGVYSSNKLMNRPEYIGGMKQDINFTEVLSTAQTTSGEVDTPIGAMAGHGVSANIGKNMKYFAEEHGWIMGIVSIRPKTQYYQGMHKMWLRKEATDYYWPSFAHIGEQEILNKEVKVDHTDPDGTFGYIPRYSEYRYIPSRVSGEMRDTLLYWHLARRFMTDPALNSDFIQCDPRTDIFSVTDPNEDHVIAHIYNDVFCNRRMPTYGKPQGV